MILYYDRSWLLLIVFFFLQTAVHASLSSNVPPFLGVATGTKVAGLQPLMLEFFVKRQ
jgi:hypothetical protein